MSAMDKVKNALHLNKDNTTTSTTGTHSTGTHTTGTHHNTVPEGTAGPHNSRVANAADPRVDSDLDSTRTGAVGAGYTGAGTGAGVGAGTTGGVVDHTGTVHTAHGAHGGHTTHNTTTGPHSSNLLNKVDPRVDSDRDGSRNMGAATGTTGASAYTGNTTHTGHTGTHAGTGLGSTGTHTGVTGTHTGAGIGSTGTHTGTHTGGIGSTGTHGGISHSTNAGPHNSNLMNKADPRVDSDLDGRGNRTGAHTGGIMGASGSHATPGSGTAQNTAGPHNSDMMNKLDPRVDADLDGSKTIGGNKTNY